MVQDAVMLIKNDHRAVEHLFDRFAGPETLEERARTVGHIIHELSVHAAVEEMILYPTVRRSLAEGDRLADEAIQEHQQVKEALAELDGMDAGDARITALVGGLRTMVAQHVHEEETELLPSLQAAVGQNEVDGMGMRIEQAKAAAPTRPHPQAPNTPPGNIIAGVPTGLLDRMRDALNPSR